MPPWPLWLFQAVTEQGCREKKKSVQWSNPIPAWKNIFTCLERKKQIRVWIAQPGAKLPEHGAGDCPPATDPSLPRDAPAPSWRGCLVPDSTQSQSLESEHTETDVCWLWNGSGRDLGTRRTPCMSGSLFADTAFLCRSCWSTSASRDKSLPAVITETHLPVIKQSGGRCWKGGS